MAKRNGLTWGGTWSKPDTMHFQVDKSVSDASLSLNRMSGAAATAASSTTGLTSGIQTASQGLGTLGTGFDKFGNALSGFNPASGGSSGGGLFSWLGNLFSPSAASLNASIGFTGANTTLGAFLTGKADGGYSGPGGKYEPRGIYHAGEVIFSQADVARLGGVGNVEAIRTGRTRLGNRWSGGPADAVTVPALPYAARPDANAHAAYGGSTSVVVNNYSGQPVQTEEKRDQHGNRQMTMTIGRQVAAAMQQRGNDARRTMQSEYGIKPTGKRR